MKIAVAYSSKNGLQKEFEKRYQKTEDIPPDFFAEGDSFETINSVMNAIRSGAHEVVGIEADDSAPALLEKHRPDMVFNVAEGLFGDFRESYIPIRCQYPRIL